jgi:hypothetical protein
VKGGAEKTEMLFAGNPVMKKVPLQLLDFWIQ